MENFTPKTKLRRELRKRKREERRNGRKYNQSGILNIKPKQEKLKKVEEPLWNIKLTESNNLFIEENKYPTKKDNQHFKFEKPPPKVKNFLKSLIEKYGKL